MSKRSVVGVALLLSACADLAANVPIALQGALLPTTAANVSGSVAAASAGPSTEAGIDVTGAPNTVYGWQVNQGTCASPGAMLGGLGNYPAVETDGAGAGRLQRTFIGAQLRRGARYHAVIVQESDRSVVLACGNLEAPSF